MTIKLKWGILGAARVNERLLPAIIEAPNSQLVAIASRRVGAAKATLEKYAPNLGGELACYDDLDALINDKNIDAIYCPMANEEHAEWAIKAITSGMPHVVGGRVRALAVTGPKRSPLAPELPTLAEAGLPGFSSVTWFGLYAPKGLDADLARRIHAEFAKALLAPDVVDRLAKLGAEPARAGSAADFAAVVAADSARWGQIIRERKISLE